MGIDKVANGCVVTVAMHFDLDMPHYGKEKSDVDEMAEIKKMVRMAPVVITEAQTDRKLEAFQVKQMLSCGLSSSLWVTNESLVWLSLDKVESNCQRLPILICQP